MSIQKLTLEEETKLLLTTKDIPEFNLIDNIKICKVISVYDGDTIKVCFYHNGIINKWNIRLIGLDTPELRPSRKLPNREEEIKKAKESRDYLKSILLTNNESKLFYLKCYDFDKYGRLLGEIFNYQPILFDATNTTTNNTQIGGSTSILHPLSINTLMITKKYAKYYDGGKR